MASNPPIDLSEDEEVVIEVQRSFFGVVGIYVTTVFVAGACLFAAYMIQKTSLATSSGISAQSAMYLSLIAAIMGLLSLMFGYVAATIYWENRMFITNEAVHQIVRRGFFDKSNQRISLMRVESAKANQRTMTQRIFNYGTLVFATEGEDVDYSITYVKNPSGYPKIFYDTQQEHSRNKRGDIASQNLDDKV